MQSFKISRRGVKSLLRWNLIRIVFLCLCCLAVFYYWHSTVPPVLAPTIDPFPVLMVFLSVVMTVAVFLGMRKAGHIIESYFLTFGDGLVTRERVDLSPMSLDYKGIKEIITDTKGAYAIKGAYTIYVPAGMERGDELESALSGIRPLRKTAFLPNPGAVRTLFIVVGMTLVVPVSLPSITDRAWVLVSGILATGTLCYGFISLQKNPYISLKARRVRWLLLWVLVLTVGITIHKLKRGY